MNWLTVAAEEEYRYAGESPVASAQCGVWANESQ
jgi:hypothetical protein